MFRNVLILVLSLALLSGCNLPLGGVGNELQPQVDLQNQIAPAIAVKPAVDVKVPEPAEQPLAKTTEVVPLEPTATTDVRQPQPASEQAGTPEATEVNTAAINPLTGLPVSDSANLALAPALVSITNFPVSARPQAGLSYSPFVFEMYIGEGMTRFLAVFYGDFPETGTDAAVTLADDRIGPVRSGRLPYESLRKLYNGFLVMASASPNVKASLSSFSNVWGSDSGNINSAMIPVTRLKEIASQNAARLEENRLSGLTFDQDAPQGGETGKGLWIPYNYLNQVIWRYDPSSQAYLRFQDNADGQTFIQSTERLTGEPLTYENVVILFANHEAQRETLIDINFMYIDKMPALLFRDGRMYEIYWTTANTDYEKTTGLVRPIRFIDAEGNPFPLKPGQTWVEIVQQFTRYNETVDSEVYFDLKKKSEPGSGFWAIHFFPTIPEK